MGNRKMLPKTPTVASLGWFWTPPKLPDTSRYSKLSFALTVSFFSLPLQCRKKWQNEFATEAFLTHELSWLAQSPVGQDTLCWETSSLGLTLGIPAHRPMNTAEEPLQVRIQLNPKFSKNLWTDFFLLLIDPNLCCTVPVIESHWLTGEWGKSGLLLHTLRLNRMSDIKFSATFPLILSSAILISKYFISNCYPVRSCDLGYQVVLVTFPTGLW